MKLNNEINQQTVKELLEFAKKSPEVVNLQCQCQEIVEERRTDISQKVIDDAFDAFGIIVKEIANTPEEELNLQKFCAKYFFNYIIKSHGVEISD